MVVRRTRARGAGRRGRLTPRGEGATAIPAGLQVPFDHELIVVKPGPRSGFPFIVAIHSTRETEPVIKMAKPIPRLFTTG